MGGRNLILTVSLILAKSYRSNSPELTSVWSSGFFDNPGTPRGASIVEEKKFWSFRSLCRSTISDLISFSFAIDQVTQHSVLERI